MGSRSRSRNEPPSQTRLTPSTVLLSAAPGWSGQSRKLRISPPDRSRLRPAKSVVADTQQGAFNLPAASTPVSETPCSLGTNTPAAPVLRATAGDHGASPIVGLVTLAIWF